MVFKSRFTSDQKDEMARLYFRDDMSMKEIGARYGVSGVAIWKILQKPPYRALSGLRHTSWISRRRSSRD